MTRRSSSASFRLDLTPEQARALKVDVRDRFDTMSPPGPMPASTDLDDAKLRLGAEGLSFRATNRGWYVHYRSLAGVRMDVARSMIMLDLTNGRVLDVRARDLDAVLQRIMERRAHFILCEGRRLQGPLPVVDEKKTREELTDILGNPAYPSELRCQAASAVTKLLDGDDPRLVFGTIVRDVADPQLRRVLRRRLLAGKRV